MANREDKFRSIFQSVEGESYVDGNVVRIGNRPQSSVPKSPNSRKFTAQKQTDSKIIPLTPKLIAEHRKNSSKIDAKKAKIMKRYRQELKKLEEKERKQNLKLAKNANKYKLREDRQKQRNLRISRQNAKQMERQREKQRVAEEKKTSKKAREIQRSLNKTIKADERKAAKERKKREEYERKHPRRLTPPKKRNIFSRFHHMRKYIKGNPDYLDIEDDIQDYKDGLISKKVIENEWEDVQEYEDARDDVKLRRGWTAFKVALAGIALAGSLFAYKTTINSIVANAPDPVAIAQQNSEITEGRAKNAAYKFEDQKLFYEYTDGNPTVENWEKLSEEVKIYIRNPLTAAEAAYKYGNDQSHFYEMTGELSTEAWEKLPPELKEFIREPIATAREAAEEGQDQMYLYKLSRGLMTEEFLLELRAEIKQYIRNPIELAKQFAEKGDYLGYINLLMMDHEIVTDYARAERWRFLPDELKQYVPDPSTVAAQEQAQQPIISTDDEIGER